MNTQSNTLDFYNEHAHDFIEQTIHVDMDALYRPFINSLSNSDDSYILDLGCGSGRDAAYFASLGYRVSAIDGSQQLIDRAESHHIKDIDWQCCSFNDLVKKDWQNKFNGIWACASLLHVPFNELSTLINTLLMMLKKGGVFYMSFKYGDGERVDNERFFCDMNEKRWQDIKLHLDSRIKDTTWLTLDQRKDRDNQWFNVLIKI
ncbi:class I SAM-dependent methyltransferase [Psychrobacter jeotgali]|uniref:class I SAM-dependent methyltransferase n=1 Tax=Psychrobacter jeotgali TaxID=179010 RepID=UPI001918FE6D|nr:class I SAM-dependent methyltransferase [Psychrobacter jeotgali]